MLVKVKQLQRNFRRNCVYLTESVYEVVWQNQFPHKSFKASLIITNMKKKLTDLCGN